MLCSNNPLKSLTKDGTKTAYSVEKLSEAIVLEPRQMHYQEAILVLARLDNQAQLGRVEQDDSVKIIIKGQ